MEREYSSKCSTSKHLKSGKWRNLARWRPADGSGEWHQISHHTDVACYPDKEDNRGKRQAEAEGREWLASLKADEARRAAQEAAEEQSRNDGRNLTSDSTVGQYFSYYLAERLPALKALEASTMAKYRRYAGYLSRDFDGFVLGCRALSGLTRADVTRWVKGLADNFNYVAVKESLRLLQQALDEARLDGFIAANPAEGVTAPVKKQARRVTWLDAGNRARLLADLDKTLATSRPGSTQFCNALGVKIALLTGLREGEVCGLRWQDVELGAAPAIHVRKAVARAEKAEGGQGSYLKDPKSERSKRTIPYLAEDLAEDLARYKAFIVAEIQDKRIGRDVEELFVIGDAATGEFKQPVYLSRAFKRAARRMGLKTNEGKAPHFHDLRHTFATVAAHNRVPETELRDIMGHSNISTTHDYYIGEDREAARKAMREAVRAITGEGAKVYQLEATA